MKCIIAVTDIRDDDITRVGGKAHALAVMMKKGMNVPRAIVITTDAYDSYVTTTGLRTQLMMELNRKTHDDTRWEELWDISLRVRTMFVNMPLPEELYNAIKESVETFFSGTSVVVRSSAPGEDAAGTSFAGLHASFVNVRGTESVIDHIKLVWASLWSDASLLYRTELGLHESRSSMAVVVQEIITGDVSGIAFSQSPHDPAQCIIEAVYGLNQGLVDGTLEPDRWILDRTEGSVISHAPAVRNQRLCPSENGTELVSLRPELKARPPLSDANVRNIYRTVMNAEGIFGLPQDVEWTIKDDNMYVLQSRPITTPSRSKKGDKRGWYLSLRRSFDNLKSMRDKIEHELIPALQRETEALAHMDLTSLTDRQIIDEASARRSLFERWKKTYWDYFIPFAHGMRLFGTFYNDTVHPMDPYEFLMLLRADDLMSLQRNDLLEELASYVRGNEHLIRDLSQEHYSEPGFQGLLQQFIASHGDLICRSRNCEEETPAIVNMVIEMSSSAGKRRDDRETIQEKEKMFLAYFTGAEKDDASALLDLARASYRMRDNDNIYMGRLKARVLEAQEELSRRFGTSRIKPSLADQFDSLSVGDRAPAAEGPSETVAAGFRLQNRQITGQPAGPGIATGPARVISRASDLMNFKKGEVLVCDAIDPNMTFVVPLACAIIERRGGMLIHGAIIAREYGLPCVTGIARATALIKTGDRVTVDGYLGIVIIAVSPEKAG